MPDALSPSPAPSRPWVRPDVTAFLAYLDTMAGPRIHELDAPAARSMYRATRELADMPVGELAVVRDVVIPAASPAAGAGGIPARLFDARADRGPGPVVLFSHGGGFVIGDLDTHAGFCAEAARVLDLPVLAIDYRLAPEHPWPAAPDDCEAAARWLATGPAMLEREVTGLVLMGDSAGGTLSIVTAMALRDAPAAVPVVMQATVYPATDWTRPYPSFDIFSKGYLLTEESMAWFADAYRADPAHPRGSPMAATVAGLPPAVVMTAGLDPIRDQGRAYAAALIGAGIAVTYREAAGTIHGFTTLRRALPSAVGDVAEFLAAVKAGTMAATTRAAA
ncbi:alpha/beta hydrolase [Sphingomonas bacterium]|uniref:alpha/beta hydrolase n=1 Tax=Sphingomonas bacterium TaxID=1895847 RepID=UPI0015766ED6|nr:alpha/beta hydrolase [Sphingomonas bacterium]